MSDVSVRYIDSYSTLNGMSSEQQQIAKDKQQRVDYQILEDIIEQISIGADSQKSNFHKYVKQAKKEGLRY